MIRDHLGHWIRGYSCALGLTNSVIAKLWVLRDGLIIAKDLGFNYLIVELDALSVVHMINSDNSNTIAGAFIEKFLTNEYNLYTEKLINVLTL